MSLDVLMTLHYNRVCVCLPSVPNTSDLSIDIILTWITINFVVIVIGAD